MMRGSPFTLKLALMICASHVSSAIAQNASVFPERPHILHNRKTGKFVCWIKVRGLGPEYRIVLTADKITEPFIATFSEVVETCRIVHQDAVAHRFVRHPLGEQIEQS